MRKLISLTFLSFILFYSPLQADDVVNEAVEIAGLIPIDIEGVYKVKDPRSPGKFLFITVLQNIYNKKLTLSIATEMGSVLFFTSATNFTLRDNGEVSIKAASVDMKNIRKSFSFEINPNELSISGSIKGNFLRDLESLDLQGKKEISLLDVLREGQGEPCPKTKEAFEGDYEGHFGSKKATLRLMLIANNQDELILSGSLGLGTIMTPYHDSFLSPSLNLLTLVADNAYEFAGKTRKMMLMCQSTDEGLVLKGVHMANNGQVVKDIVFKKIK